MTLLAQQCPCDEGCAKCGDTGFINPKRLGRPPIPAEQRLKQRAARWTDSAWEACERKAQAAGMSTAAWIRKVTEEAESV